jgi:hypothetical protein
MEKASAARDVCVKRNCPVIHECRSWATGLATGEDGVQQGPGLREDFEDPADKLVAGGMTYRDREYVRSTAAFAKRRAAAAAAPR